MDDWLTHLLMFVHASARTAREAHAAQQATAVTDEKRWAMAGPLLRRVADPNAYPLATRVGTAAGMARHGAQDPAHMYEFGRQRLFDGLACLIDRSCEGDH